MHNNNVNTIQPPYNHNGILFWQSIWLFIVLAIVFVVSDFMCWILKKENEFIQPRTEEEIQAAKFKQHHNNYQKHTLLCTKSIDIACPFPRVFDAQEQLQRIKHTIQYAPQLFSVVTILSSYIDDENRF